MERGGERGDFLLELHFANDAIVGREGQGQASLHLQLFILGLSPPYNEARTKLE